MVVIETEYRALLIENSRFGSSFLLEKQNKTEKSIDYYLSIEKFVYYLSTLTLQVMALLMKKYIAAPQEREAKAM